MFQKLIVLSLVALTVFLLSCGSTELPLTYNSIRGSGNLFTVYVKDLEPFHSVTLNTVGDVNLTYSTGSNDSVFVTVDHNLQRFITTEVTNSVLLIDLKTPKEVKVTGQTLTVDITMRGLNRVVLDVGGVGDIKTDSSRFHVSNIDLVLAGVGDMDLELNVDSAITSILTGVGDLTLSGRAHRHDLTHEGVGAVHAFGFVTDSCTLVSNSEGDIEVFVERDLNATINNSGDVYYRGYPALETSGTGVGELIDTNE